MLTEAEEEEAEAAMEEVAEAEVTEGIANVFAGTKNFALFGGGPNQVRAEYLAIMYFVVVYNIKINLYLLQQPEKHQATQ